jgi:hypothetical protein
LKVFEEKGRINFIDIFDNAVGFSFSQCCCEDFGWSISKNPDIFNLLGSNYELSCSVEEGIDLNNYMFNGGYLNNSNGNDDIQKSVVRFELINLDGVGEDFVYLYLYNFHNGYYSHGFDANIGGERIEDSL